MQSFLILFFAVVGLCRASVIKPDKFITGLNSYYVVIQRTCGFIHCDLVYQCSINRSSIRTGQYNCTRLDQRTQTYQIYKVQSQENGIYCEDIETTETTTSGVTVMTGRCCKDLIQCKQHGKKEYELAVMQIGQHLNGDGQQDEEKHQHNSGRFALALYQISVQLYPFENVMLCPICVMDSLNLLRSGSKGITWHQLTQILGANKTEIQETGERNKEDYKCGSAVFYDKDRELNPTFKQAAETSGAVTIPSPLSSNPLRASFLIADWLQNNTNMNVEGTHETETGESNYNEDLVIASSMAFNGNWKATFDPYRRAIEKFISLDGTVYDVEMLNSGEPVKYRMKRDQELKAKVIEIPFKESTVVMTLVIPERVDGLPLIEEYLTLDVLQGLRRNLEFTDVFLTLPQIKHTYYKNLDRALSHMGADRLFRNSDLSGIYEDRSRLPRISRFIQAASIDLNNNLEASGAAVSNLESFRVSPEQIMVDRPFLFMLEETISKTYLLMGRVAH